MDLILKIKRDIDEHFNEGIDRKAKLGNAEPLTDSQKHHCNAIISRLVCANMSVKILQIA